MTPSVRNRLPLFASSMVFIVRSIVIVLLLTTSLWAADGQWTPERVPATGAFPFVLYYRQFLRANPFAIDTRKDTPEQRAENRQRHQQAAALYAAMSNMAMQLAEADGLLPSAPEGIKKDPKQKIGGTWNLYPNVPINAADLRLEALFMHYRALSHQVSLDPKRIGMLHDFVVTLNAHDSPTGNKSPDHPLSLYQHTCRSVCLRALSFAYNPLKDHADDPSKPLPSRLELEQHISLAIEWFLPFVEKFPNEENIKKTDAFFDTMELFRTAYPDSERRRDWTMSFHQTLAAIQERTADPLILEYAGTYDGILRHWELLGKEMPIWGADMTGKIMDDQAWKGKVVLLDFWATWCGPCLAEFPHLKLLYQKYHDKGFEIVGYSVDADQRVLTKYLEEHPVPWIMLSKEKTEQSGLPPLSLYYGAKSLPVVMLRDRSGKAVLLDARGEALDNMLEAMFEEEESE